MLRTAYDFALTPADLLVRRFPVLLSVMPVALVGLLVIWPANTPVVLLFCLLGAAWIDLLCRQDARRADLESGSDTPD